LKTAGGWRKSHNEKLRDFLLLTKRDQGYYIKQDDMGGACRMERKNVDGNKPFARSRRRLGTVLKRFLEE